MKPHKHCELIKAWADGAEIEQFISQEKGGLGGWQPFDGNWNKLPDYYGYRIKPKKDRIEYLQHTSKYIYKCEVDEDIKLANLKLTFDGETGELKSAEVLK